MKQFDVFNGDADGLCSLHQLRLATPRDAILVTGVKRDIALLKRVPATAGDAVTVLDISLDVNRTELLALLARGVTIQYFDHHGSGEVPVHPGLHAAIDTTPNTCTGIIVDHYLGGRHRIWAVVAAFGDNMHREARRLSNTLALDPKQVEALQELGECLNYNGYGDTEADLVAHPAAVYEILKRQPDPFRFMDEEPVFREIRQARMRDLETARQAGPLVAFAHGKIFVLPDAPWSRRVRGAYGNILANACPEQAHAILTPDAHGGYTVSVRAPLARRAGARELCSRFPTGGGRAAAGGINHLPSARLQEFIVAFEQSFRP